MVIATFGVIFVFIEEVYCKEIVCKLHFLNNRLVFSQCHLHIEEGYFEARAQRIYQLEEVVQFVKLAQLTDVEQLEIACDIEFVVVEFAY